MEHPHRCGQAEVSRYLRHCTMCWKRITIDSIGGCPGAPSNSTGSGSAHKTWDHLVLIPDSTHFVSTICHEATRLPQIWPILKHTYYVHAWVRTSHFCVRAGLREDGAGGHFLSPNSATLPHLHLTPPACPMIANVCQGGL
jgi:hypothetical protein